ncbi:hypothetical protein BKA57DRAFT_509063 [Linnemannia elongata]|nr:hypothetical protein BKA57DRAFT_509063 [Linnemannia elongata]
MLDTWKLQVMNRSGVIAAAAAATIIVLAVGGRGSSNARATALSRFESRRSFLITTAKVSIIDERTARMSERITLHRFPFWNILSPAPAFDRIQQDNDNGFAPQQGLDSPDIQPLDPCGPMFTGNLFTQNAITILI